MKRCAMILALLALFAVMPAFAADTPSPLPSWLAAPQQSCPAPTPTVMPNGLFTEPLLWNENMGPVEAAGCATYCRDCGGCCAILGPNLCACC